ncbi:hypothetical protein AUK10_01515 [Candidatus Gracilibacteria bacterium CG2_30_37_12]|nr:MAG: hypothetical protein AUK10_01515 [Candidatus Gracilibacteria bacterium CG2_30_37_12]
MHYIFDTSFILSLVMIDDVNHKEAVKIFSSIPENTIFHINEITYIELLTVITYKLGFSSTKTTKEMIMDLGTIFLNSGNMEYIKFFEFIGKKISVVDTSIVYDAMRYDLSILTFDKEILQLANKLQ